MPLSFAADLSTVSVAPSRALFGLSTRLSARAKQLDERAFDGIRFRGPGTDLFVGLLPTSRWSSAEDETVEGRRFVANVPTEEVYTTPDPARAEGVVSDIRLRVTLLRGEGGAQVVVPNAELFNKTVIVSKTAAVAPRRKRLPDGPEKDPAEGIEPVTR